MLKQERCFPKSDRLRKPVEFRATFASGKRHRCRVFTITVSANKLNHPRLGLAISKKAASRAVDRNRIKRITRESFRCNAASMKPVDVVVQITSRARAATNQMLQQSLDKLWTKIT